MFVSHGAHQGTDPYQRQTRQIYSTMLFKLGPD